MQFDRTYTMSLKFENQFSMKIHDSIERYILKGEVNSKLMGQLKFKGHDYT